MRRWLVVGLLAFGVACGGSDPVAGTQAAREVFEDLVEMSVEVLGPPDRLEVEDTSRRCRPSDRSSLEQLAKWPLDSPADPRVDALLDAALVYLDGLPETDSAVRDRLPTGRPRVISRGSYDVARVSGSVEGLARFDYTVTVNGPCR